MLVYYIFWLFLLFFCFEPQGKNKIFRIAIATLFALLLGFRKNVGTDYLNYVDYFKYEQWLAYLEPGYNLVNKIVSFCGGEVVWVFLIMASISTFFIYLSLNNKKIIYYPSALLCYTLCFPFLTNGVRQALAVSIFFYCYKYIEEKRFLYYFLLILLASLFHMSALILLPFYFILNKSFKRYHYITLYLLSFVFIFINFQHLISPYLYLFGKYALFANSPMFTEGSGLNLGAIFSLSYLIIFFTISMLTKIFEKEPVLFNLSFLFLLLKNVQINSSIVGRISVYFEWFVLLLLPIVIRELKINRNLKYLLIIFYILIFSLLIINSYSSKYSMAPYNFFWDN